MLIVRILGPIERLSQAHGCARLDVVEPSTYAVCAVRGSAPRTSKVAVGASRSDEEGLIVTAKAGPPQIFNLSRA